jgi:F-box/leucine-rich repeat protein 10/11
MFSEVRKSKRAHTAVDYAGLNEGVLRTSDDNPEHHYISAFKNGDLDFVPETFARLPPELVTAEYLEKSNGFKEPIVVPAALNPRPTFPSKDQRAPTCLNAQPSDLAHSSLEHCGYETVQDNGQDMIDMVIPEGLTVRRVSELYGPSERVPVIDVKAQEGEDKRWTMAKWADYYEQTGEKPVRNVISLEVSKSTLGRLIQRPKAVRDMDLQDSVWPDDDKHHAPPVQFYCLMSVADCYTDFHIDFGGSSVFYHIVKGRKTFFFIPPTKQNLKKYEDWCLSPKMGHEFLGHQVKECYRVDLYPGDTMLIPSGWIHAVWTPEDSLVIGGNFLTRIHYSMQIRVLEIEKNTKVALKFRYPYFQKIMWLVVIKYLENDRIPAAVEQLLLRGGQFERSIPIYCETDKFGHNSHPGPENYNARYYSKAELKGLTDLSNYIWRTVMISLGKVEGITQTVRNAVTKSIPKGHGEPIHLARRFAIWMAWKRGNETIPQWALSSSPLPETAEANGDKKAVVVGDRQSTRIRGAEPEPSPPDSEESQVQNLPALPMTGFLRPSTDLARHLSAHMSTPKTSQLGPKRIACDACRKRRIRCKHKDEIVETKSANGSTTGAVSTIDLSGSLPISVKRRGSEADLAFGPLLNPQSIFDAPTIHAGPISADLSTDPFALKSGRVKACADCRKSKVSSQASIALY